MYVNGNAGRSEILPELWQRPRGNLSFGGSGTAGVKGFSGLMDNIRLIHGTPYEGTFSPAATFESGDDLFGFSFDSGKGAEDMSGHGFDGVFIGEADTVPGSI